MSIDNLNRLSVGPAAENIEDCFLERQPSENQGRSMLFFGLAVVFGAVAMVSNSSEVVSIPRTPGLASDNLKGNTGSSLKGVSSASRASEFEQISRDGSENEYWMETDSAESASQSAYTAMMLLV